MDSRPITRASALSLAALMLLGGAAHARSAPSKPKCPTYSWVAGTVDLCDGVLVYNDYVDDDYGADTGAYLTSSRTSGLSPTAGDETYPEGQIATADLVRLTLGVNGNRLEIDAELNALFKRNSTVVAVAIDSDGDQETGGGAWGDLNVSSAGWDDIAFFSKGDVKSNTIHGSMPLPRGDKWRVQAATAIADTGHVMNVAFRGPYEEARFKFDTNVGTDVGSWFEDKQAAALATGDISEFGHEVELTDLKNEVTRFAKVGPGLHERVYRSDYTVPPGEGVDPDGVPGRGDGGGQAPLGFEQKFQFLGHYQPYGIYIPDKPGPHGMQMAFHGSGANLTSLINQPGMQSQIGEDLNRILVVPEARGADGYGSDISERDLLDVMDDVIANYPIDEDKVFASGYSQGGYISHRMSALYPHRFAGVVSWVGFTGDAFNGTPVQGTLTYTAGGVGNVIDLVGNLRSVPTLMLYGAEDELVQLHTAMGMLQAFRASDSPYLWYMHTAAEHLTFAVLDDWAKEAEVTSEMTRIEDPARVTYRTAKFLGDPSTGIAHDRAYWVSKIRGRDKAFIDVDLSSAACGGKQPTYEPGVGAGPGPVPWVADHRMPTGVEKAERKLELTGDLKNVASLTIDTGDSCLGGETFSYEITTDGPVTLTFDDGRELKLSDEGTHEGTLGK